MAKGEGLPPILALSERFRERLVGDQKTQARRMIQLYLGIWRDTLLPQVRRLEREIAAMATPTPYKVQQLATSVRTEIMDFARIVGRDMTDTMRQAIADALQESTELIIAGASFNRRVQVAAELFSLNAASVEVMASFLSPASPLVQMFDSVGPHVAQGVQEKIMAGIVLGHNPRVIARDISRTTAQSLTWALRTTRTAQMYAYREATRQNFVANAHVLDGWIWSAALDSRCCMSCIDQHGSLHPVYETLNEHHNGRCGMIPMVKDTRSPIQESGEDWFKRQSLDMQRRMMGPKKHEAWLGGMFEFNQLTHTRVDKVWGPMKTEASLRAILGEGVASWFLSNRRFHG